MIEINPTFSQKKDKLKSKKNQAGLKSLKVRESFQTTLVEQIEDAENTQLEELLEDLRDQEQKFLDSQSLADLTKYKIKVKKILDMIIKGSLKTTTLQRRRRDRADFLIIKQINDNLMILSKELIKNNKSFDLLKKIDEIRGLIFDLVY